MEVGGVACPLCEVQIALLGCSEEEQDKVMTGAMSPRVGDSVGVSLRVIHLFADFAAAFATFNF
jgi:hypothetical protein